MSKVDNDFSANNESNRVVALISFVFGGTLFLVVGSACTSKFSTSVPLSVPENSRLGDIVMDSSEKPPYPPTHGIAEKQVRAAATRFVNQTYGNNLTQQQRDQLVEQGVQAISDQRQYGPAVKLSFTSRQNSNGTFNEPCPRWIQVVRRRVEIRNLQDEVIQTVDFHQTITEPDLKPVWIVQGGNPIGGQGNGWFIDKIPPQTGGIGDHPVYQDDNFLGVYQAWSAGTTTMFDIPGFSNPYDKDFFKNKIFVHTFEARTWALSRQKPDIACSGIGEQPPLDPQPPVRINRTPLGFISWTFTIKVRVGTSADTTTVLSLDFPTPTWSDDVMAQNTEDGGRYSTLMTNNYANWAPPYGE